MAGCIAANMGHKNAAGLSQAGKNGLQRMFKAGLLVDLAHMSEQSTENALAIAERYRMPVLDTHTGFRDERSCALSERSMTFAQARRLSGLGGVVGLGTEGDTQPTPLLYVSGSPVIRFTGDVKTHTWSLQLPDFRSGMLDQMTFDIRTGGDDLRGGNDNAFAVLFLRGGGRKEFPLNGGANWGGNSTNSVTIPLSPSLDVSTIEGIGIRTTFGGGMGGDNWNMDRLTVSFRVASHTTTVFNMSAAPLVRFTGDLHEKRWNVNPGTLALTPCTPPDRYATAGTVASRVAVTIKTGGDDLRGNNDNAFAIFTLTGNKKIQFPLNEGYAWANDMIVKRIFALPAGTKVSDIKSITINTTFGGGISGDNWNMDEIRVDALTDPIPNWIRDYQEVTGLMSGRSVAMGTDINGLAPQISYTGTPVRYPIDIGKRLGMPGIAALPKHHVGNRTFDMTNDGIAHIGMFPDFIQAIAQAPGGDNVARSLFHSAEEVIRMWEKIEAAKGSIPNPK